MLDLDFCKVSPSKTPHCFPCPSKISPLEYIPDTRTPTWEWSVPVCFWWVVAILLADARAKRKSKSKLLVVCGLLGKKNAQLV